MSLEREERRKPNMQKKKGGAQREDGPDIRGMNKEAAGTRD